MLVLPNNMSCYYGHQTLDIFNFLSIYSILGIVLFILLVFYFFKLIKTENPIWYAVVFFGIAISMYLNIVKVVPGIVGDRFVFSASIGFSILIVYLLLFYINKNLKINSLKEVNVNFKISFALLCLVYSIITIQRNSEWKDRFTLYSHDVLKWPESAALNILYSNIILVNLNHPNTFLTDQNKNNYITKAAESLNNVLKVDSLNTTALNNIGFIKQKIYNDYAAAIPYYMKSLSVDSTKFEVQLNLCQCLRKTSNYPLAQSLVLKLFTDNQKNQEVLDLMGNILIENKKIKEGIQIFKALSDEQPNNNSINIILGNFYIADFDSINAKTYYTKALDNDKNNPQLIKMIARLSE
ncbi:MAG: tetratricopeptide repeat protein [Bacteroidetes bacterium]|nr:tetratricopeptide repeat protein [Bacteroidota bacterium]